jgi:hypothetical protein
VSRASLQFEASTKEKGRLMQDQAAFSIGAQERTRTSTELPAST